MLRISSAVSGEEMAVLDAAEIEGKSGKELKRLLAPRLGYVRFRQRLLFEDGREVHDDTILTLDDGTLNLQMVFLAYCPSDEPLDMQLVFACQKGDVKTLEQLLKAPRDPEVTVNTLGTPLHMAAWMGQVECVRLLLEAGVEPDSAMASFLYGDITTPLHAAADLGQTEVIRLLVAAGARLEKTTAHGSSPLHLASAGGHVAAVRLLLELGEEGDIDRGDGIGATALHAAIGQNRVEVVQLLLQMGANTKQEMDGPAGGDGPTALHMAAALGHLEILQLLLDHGDPLEKRSSSSGQTPLHAAAFAGQLSAVQFLVEAKADARKTTVDGRTPLCLASEMDFEEVVNFLQPGAVKRKAKTKAKAKAKARAKAKSKAKAKAKPKAKAKAKPKAKAKAKARAKAKSKAKAKAKPKAKAKAKPKAKAKTKTKAEVKPKAAKVAGKRRRV
eukprot:s982_g7.t1